MARGRRSTAQAAAITATTTPSARDNFKLRQYEQILLLQDAILSGKHPRIKLPPGADTSSQAPNSAAQPSVQVALSKNLQSFTSNAQKPAFQPQPFQGAGVDGAPTGPRSGRAEINPILLEKSDGLIRAELQLQRQRLELSLRDEVEQRRVAKHAQTEPLAEFDLSDVLTKALTLVQTGAPPPATETLTANEAASDSFDDNTFYSSRHDTPESQLTSRVRIESEEPQALATVALNQPIRDGAGLFSQPTDSATGNHTFRETQQRQRYDGSTTDAISLPQAPLVPGLNNYTGGVVSAGPSQNTSGEQSQSEDWAPNSELEQQGHGVMGGSQQQLSDAYVAAHPPSPLVRAHNLLPVAPQPSQVSYLATARRFPRAGDPGSIATISATGTPAQVAALRIEPGVVTSPESSPQNGKFPDRKRGKKKKRKADRQAHEAEPMPYIKPEPQSPEPIGTMSYIRPTKRPRHAPQRPDEPEYLAPDYDHPHPIAYGTQEQQHVRPYRDERIPVGYEGVNVYPQRAASTAMIGDPRHGGEYMDDRRMTGEAYVRHYPPPGMAGLQYASVGPQLERPASRIVVDDPYMIPPRSYREPHNASRMTARPENGFNMGPPRPQQTRVVVDASGREYLEPPPPPPPSSVRRSVAPSMRPSESEVMYERAPARAFSRHSGAGLYDESNMIYARPSPPRVMPRRVVTQPEYIPQEYRDSRPREYSMRPMAPHGEYVQVMAPQDRRPVDEGQRDHVARAASVRPAEPVRYGVPQDYGRMQSMRPEGPGREYATSVRPDMPAREYATSVRPDVPPREYATSVRPDFPPREYAATVHPDNRREVIQPFARGYGGPVEQPAVRQEYGARPVERYYDPQALGGEEMAFIGRPRGAPQDVVYAEDARREVYR